MSDFKQGGFSNELFNLKKVQTYYDGYGWMNNESRTDERDKNIEKLLGEIGYSKDQIAEFLISVFGRYIG